MGNASCIDRKREVVIIKPSGVDYDKMTVGDMVVVDLDGKIIEGQYRPSADLSTHLELYKNSQEMGGVVHTHSKWATSYAQAEIPISCYGTTHADNFYGEILCTRMLAQSEVEKEYELNTGRVIVETSKKKILI